MTADLMTVREACELLGLGKDTVLAYWRQGLFTGVQGVRGGKVLLHRHSVQAFAEGAPVMQYVYTGKRGRPTIALQGVGR
jgi:excisionase family DNA binding protein